MADNWIGHVAATRPKYMKTASDLTIRERLFFSFLKKRGRITFNHSGTDLKWPVKFSLPRVTPSAGVGLIDFTRHNPNLQLSIDWRGYQAQGSLSMKDGLMNKGDEAIIKLFDQVSDNLVQATRETIGSDMYQSGSTAGRESNIHGCETFMDSGTTVVADKVAKPAGTYAGHSCALGAEGGSWSTALAVSPNASVDTDWPNGSGTSEYDCLAPKLINYGSTSWNTPSPSNTWALNCRKAFSQVVTWLSITGGKDGMPTFAPLAVDLFQTLKDSLLDSQRILVPHKEAEDLGFGNTLNIDGVAAQPDFDCPAQTGYMFNLSTIEVCSLCPELLWMKGPEEIAEASWATVWGVGFFGNVTWQPKYTAKFANYASS